MPSQSSLFYDEVYLFQLCLLSLLTLSFHEMPIIRLWNLWCVVSSFLFCVAVNGHNSALYNTVDITNDSYNLTLSVALMCLSSALISVFQIRCWLCRLLFGYQSLFISNF